MHPLRRLVRLALPLVVVPLLVTTVSPQEPSADDQSVGRSAPRPFRFRSIGPASMGGRIDDVEVAESDPNIIYLGYAIGGVWKSENNGTTFEPVFDTYTTASIGDIAIHPTNPNIVYVGTGEAEQPPDLVVRRRHLQDDRRRQDLHQHRAEGDADDRAHRHRSEESGNRLRRGARPPVRTEPRARRLQDDRRRQDVEQGQVHRRRHRLHRHRDRSREHEHPLRGELPAAAQRLLLQRRRSGQRALEDDGRRARRGRS